jgi:hypothetical protein
MTYRSCLPGWVCLLAAVGGYILVGHSAHATTVTISRMNDGVVCNGWVVSPSIIATAAHCVLTPGHYSVSTAEAKYEVLRIWIHPEFSPELLYLAFFKDEFDHDVAILQIIQREFSVEVHDHLKDKELPPDAKLFAVRPKRTDRQNYKEVEELPYAQLEFKKKGLVISNNGEDYAVCPGDSGTPLYARVADVVLVVGIIVGNAPVGKLRSETFCGNEIRVIDASVILQFLHSISRLNRKPDDARQ